jgi:uncharacterized membrane protein YedE/YeeE
MELSQINSQTQLVLWLSLVLGIVFGALMQRTHFCTMGAVADVINFGSWGRARMAALAIGVAVLGTQALSALGLIDLSKSIYTGGRFVWAAYALGGGLFGFGMVLAGGCGSKTLLRMGGGSLKALVVFLVMGLAAYMTLRGVLGVLRVNVIEPLQFILPAQDLPRLFGLSGWLMGGVVGGVLILWALLKPEGRGLESLIAGVGIGAATVAAWYVSGHVGYVPDHPETLQEAFLATNSGRMESFSFVSPSAYWLDYGVLFSDKTKVLSFGMVTALGVVLGALAVSLMSKTFRWEGFTNTRDLAQHLIGAVMMGFGGVLAMGCTVGQGLSGVSTLALGSMLTLLCIVGGAVLALKYQMRVMEREL